MDSSHVALVSLLLRESAFADFKCDRPTSLGMNVDSLAKILKMCGPTDSLKVRWQGGADTVGFQCESGSDDRIADFDLKLMQIESEHMEIPEQHYKVTAKLPSAEFQRICRDLKEFGETMQMSASKHWQPWRRQSMSLSRELRLFRFHHSRLLSRRSLSFFQHPQM